MPKIEIELSERSYEYYVQSAVRNRRTTTDEIELRLEIPESSGKPDNILGRNLQGQLPRD